MRMMSRRRGAAAVEFALTLPILIVLTLGIIEYGWMFQRYNTLHTALRDAARDGATQLDGASAVSVAQQRLATNLAFYGFCDGSTAGCVSTSVSALASPENVIALDATWTYSPITGFPVPGIPQTLAADVTFAFSKLPGT